MSEVEVPHRAAKVVCVYRMTIRPDSTSAIEQDELTQLAISDSISEFRSCVRYKSDSLSASYAGVSMSSTALSTAFEQVRKLPKARFDGIIIKNQKLNNCIYYGRIDGVLYNYREDNYPIQWQLSADTLTINGYKCQKASTRLGGRYYNAWFTRQIPISNGPYKFGGLPGLIVSISDATSSYKFELIRIYQPNKSYSILLPTEIIKPRNSVISISRQKYYETYFADQKNVIDNFMADGNFRFENEAQMRQNLQGKLKRRNNPIEIEYFK